MTYGITQCYLPPDTSKHAPPNPSQTGWYSIYLPRRDGRLSCPSRLHSAPAGSRTRDLLITSPTPNQCTTKTTGTSQSHRALSYTVHPVHQRELNYTEHPVHHRERIQLDVAKLADAVVTKICYKDMSRVINGQTTRTT